MNLLRLHRILMLLLLIASSTACDQEINGNVRIKRLQLAWHLDLRQITSPNSSIVSKPVMYSSQAVARAKLWGHKVHYVDYRGHILHSLPVSEDSLWQIGARGRHLLSYQKIGNSIDVYDYEGKLLSQIECYSYPRISPDGRSFLLISADTSKIFLHNIQSSGDNDQVVVHPKADAVNNAQRNSLLAEDAHANKLGRALRKGSKNIIEKFWQTEHRPGIRSKVGGIAIAGGNLAWGMQLTTMAWNADSSLLLLGFLDGMVVLVDKLGHILWRQRIVEQIAYTDSDGVVRYADRNAIIKSLAISPDSGHLVIHHGIPSQDWLTIYALRPDYQRGYYQRFMGLFNSLSRWLGSEQESQVQENVPLLLSKIPLKSYQPFQIPLAVGSGSRPRIAVRDGQRLRIFISNGSEITRFRQGKNSFSDFADKRYLDDKYSHFIFNKNGDLLVIAHQQASDGRLFYQMTYFQFLDHFFWFAGHFNLDREQYARASFIGKEDILVDDILDGTLDDTLMDDSLEDILIEGESALYYLRLTQ